MQTPAFARMERAKRATRKPPRWRTVIAPASLRIVCKTLYNGAVAIAARRNGSQIARLAHYTRTPIFGVR
eukprot:8861455-Lingulodinium_polyedra.AAC.1